MFHSYLLYVGAKKKKKSAYIAEKDTTRIENS